MKTRTQNGPVNRGAKPGRQGAKAALKSALRGVAEMQRLLKGQGEDRRKALAEKVEQATTLVTVRLPAFEAGILHTAAIIHGSTPEDTAGRFLVERLADWTGEGYPLEN